MPRAEHEILIDVPPDAMFGVITDYERYPEFLPEMKAVSVISNNDGIALVQFELEIIMRITYTLRLVEDPPKALSWTLDSAKMMAQNAGGWTLAEEDGKTRATYALEIELRGLIPKSVSTKLAGTTLPQTLERFKERAEKLHGGAGS